MTIFCIFDKTLEWLEFFIDHHLELGFKKIVIVNLTDLDISNLIHNNSNLELLGLTENSNIDDLINQYRSKHCLGSYSLVLKVNQFFYYQYSGFISLNEFLSFYKNKEEILSYRVIMREPEPLDKENIFKKIEVDFCYIHEALEQNKPEKIWMRTLTKKNYKSSSKIKMPQNKDSMSIVLEITNITNKKVSRHFRLFLTKNEVISVYLSKVFPGSNSYKRFFEKKVLDEIKLKEYRKKYLSTQTVANKGYQRFIITGLPRTGTNLLCSLLRKLPQVSCAAEIFNTRRIYIGSEALNTDPVLHVFREYNPLYFLDQMLWHEDHPQKIKAVGFKILKDHFLTYPVILDYIYKNPKIKIIFCTRRNNLARYYSEKFAFLTDQWTSTDKPCEISQKIKLAAPRCEEAFKSDEKFINSVTSMLEENKVEYFNLVYEDFASNISGELNKITDFLGLDRTETPISNLRKQNTSKLEDVIENYAELKEYFKTSRWKDFFEE